MSSDGMPRPRKSVTTLPVWAQDYIYALISYAEEKDKQISEMGENSDTGVLWMVRFDEHHLPERATVRFILGKEKWIDVNKREKSVYVNGSAPFIIRPMVSNAFYVEIAP